MIGVLNVRFVFQGVFNFFLNVGHLDTPALLQRGKRLDTLFKWARSVIRAKYNAHWEKRRMPIEIARLLRNAWIVVVSRRSPILDC